MKPALYKDYNKATTDLLTKNFPAGGQWKLECKYKGPKDTVFINPTASSDGKFSTDIEYAPSQCDGSIKITLTPKVFEDIKSTLTYTYRGNKCEMVFARKGSECTIEGSHEASYPIAGKTVSINEKISCDALGLGIGAKICDRFQVGCEGTYGIKSKQCKWGVGARYNQSGAEVAIKTAALKTFITTASAPFSIQYKKDTIKVTVAAETVCTRGGGFDAKMGVASTCPVCPSNELKARISKNKEWAVSYLVKLSDNWVVSACFDSSKKFGFLLTHS